MAINEDDKAILIRGFEAAVAAADAERTLAAHLPLMPKGRTIVVGAGKGAAQLAAAFEKLWDGPVSGVVVTRYGYATACDQIDVLEAAHPVPDEAGLVASEALMEAVSDLTPDDLVIALICGGGSALLPAPVAGLNFEDEQELNAALLASGAPIGVMNAIRKCASRIKGGRLAAMAHPARVVSLIVSDVPGDDPAQVASGPTVPDPKGVEDAHRLIDAYGITLSPHIRSALTEPPAPADLVFAKNETHVIASARLSLEAAARSFETDGVSAIILSDAIEGEARDIGSMHAAIARECHANGRPFRAPVVLLSGGETTVTLKAAGGRGGRNSECLLSAALGIEGLGDVTALFADTDGIDGSEANAGAFADGTTAVRMRAAGFDPLTSLSGHDAWGAFDAVGDLFSPGPTGTNVNDFRAFLIR
ncbi:MAG: glycerate kinase [Marinovum sp.]|nr:glycerate kinase [Marinovum sp.]